MIKPFAILLTLAGTFVASEADAQQQYVGRRHYAPATAPPYSSYAIQTPVYSGPTTYSSSYSAPGRVVQPARVYNYSYYSLSPLPARTYVGYGADQFPFYGVPYGHPYDPWTWPMMSGSYGNGLARYYDPPVK